MSVLLEQADGTRLVVKHLMTHIIEAIGGGAYWAGWATARPLFGSCGPPLSLARPLFWVM